MMCAEFGQGLVAPNQLVGDAQPHGGDPGGDGDPLAAERSTKAAGSRAPAKNTCPPPPRRPRTACPGVGMEHGYLGRTASPGPMDMPACRVTAKACKKVERWE